MSSLFIPVDHKRRAPVPVVTTTKIRGIASIHGQKAMVSLALVIGDIPIFIIYVRRMLPLIHPVVIKITITAVAGYPLQRLRFNRY